MPGVRGMQHTAHRKNALRSKIWQSMRILRRFTIVDLCRTTGARRDNVKKFVRRLEVHGYVAQHGTYVGGRAGIFRGLRLVKDVGPRYPLCCEICGRPMNKPCLSESEKSANEPHDVT